MKLNKNELIIRTVQDNIQSLYKEIDRHRYAIDSVLKGQSYSFESQQVLCSRELRLKKAVKNAIEVLDETRKAFKSKRLELLRRELTQALADVE